MVGDLFDSFITAEEWFDELISPLEWFDEGYPAAAAGAPSSRVHFQPGAAAANHRFRCELTYSGSTGTVTEITCKAETLTRCGDASAALGILQRCRAVYDPMPATFTEYAQLFIPSQSIALIETGQTSRVEVDGAAMTATVCGPWTLTFTELRWYVDGAEVLTSGGDSILDSSAGPYSISGDFYLQKYNQTRVSAYVEFNPEPTHGYQTCVGTTSSYSIEGDASNTGGWGWYDTGTAAWIAEPITIDSLACPSTTWPGGCIGSCTCSHALPGVSETDAYTVTVEAERYLSFVSTFLREDDCTCRVSGTGRYQVYRNVFEYREKSSYVDAVAESDTSLYTSRRYRKAGCTCRYPLLNDDYTISETETTDALAYAPHQRLVSRTTLTQDCTYGLIACPEVSGGYNPPLCLLTAPVLCYYDCQVLQDPVESCACTSSEPSVTHADDGQWVMTYACDTDIYTAYADQYRQPGNGLSFASRDTGLNGTDPAIGVYTYGGSEEWVLVYVDGGTVKYSISQDWGGSWSAGVTVDTGTRPRIHITADNRRFITYLVGTDIECKMYDGAMTEVEDAGAIQSGVDASSHHDISSYSGGQGEWVALLVYVAGGSVVAKTSNDGKAFT